MTAPERERERERERARERESKRERERESEREREREREYGEVLVFPSQEVACLSFFTFLRLNIRE